MKKIIIYLFFILNFFEVIISQESQTNIKRKYILKSKDYITKVRIQFCQSWSLVGAFQQVKDYLESIFIDVKVIPENYPLKNPRKTIYNVMIGIEILIITLILLSDFILPKKKDNENIDDDFKFVLIEEFKENKLAIIVLIFIIGIFVGKIIKNSGAFEIFCEDKLIWSTIENNGELPNIGYLIKKMMN